MICRNGAHAWALDAPQKILLRKQSEEWNEHHEQDDVSARHGPTLRMINPHQQLGLRFPPETEAHRLFWHKAEVLGPRSEFMPFDIPLALNAMTA